MDSVEADKLTLLVELPDDGVQVGVLESHVTASHRHRGRLKAALLRAVELKVRRQEEIQKEQRGDKVRRLTTSVRAEEQQQVCEEKQEELLLLLRLRLGQTSRIRSELPAPPPPGRLPAGSPLSIGHSQNSQMRAKYRPEVTLDYKIKIPGSGLFLCLPFNQNLTVSFSL